MNFMTDLKNQAIADVQNMADTRHLAINKVGIKSIRHPVVVKDKSVGDRAGRGATPSVACGYRDWIPWPP